jgi:hypothetical protein
LGSSNRKQIEISPKRQGTGITNIEFRRGFYHALDSERKLKQNNITQAEIPDCAEGLASLKL